MAYPSMITSYQQTRYNVTKCSNRRAGKKVKYIIIHYTGTKASAKNNCIYFSGGNRKASADYFIDKDGTIYKFNADCACYYSWHCGDGKGKYGITNSNSIGIEVVSAGEVFTSAQISSLKKLVNAIQADYGVADDHVVRHYDASRKRCPAPYCGSTANNNAWNTLWKTITGSVSVPSNPSSSGSSSSSGSFTIKVTDPELNIRKGPGVSYDVTGCIKDKGTYTIVDVKNGWGKLKSGAGWINLKYTTYGGGKTSSASSKPSTSSSNELIVDGKGGTKTIKKAQRVFGTAIDGKISNQLETCKKYMTGFVSSCIDWDGGSGGSVLVKAIQRWAGVRADGKWGKKTSIAVQKKLGVKADGYFGVNSMKAFQRWLNTK